MTNIEKVITLINNFTTGNLEKDYTQYNLQVEKGKYKIIGENKKYILQQNLYSFAGVGDQIKFEIIRFEGDKLKEHGYNITPSIRINPIEHSQIGGVIEVTDFDKTKENIKVVIAELDKNIGFDMMFTFVNGDKNDSKIVDSASGKPDVVNGWSDEYYMTYIKIFFVYGKGNIVLVVSEDSLYDEKGSFYELFRVQDSKIVEHWTIYGTNNKKNEQ